MKLTRRLDELHRIVLPYEVISKMGWTEKTELDIELSDDHAVTLKSHSPFCKLCGNTAQELIRVNSALLCSDCLSITRTV